MYIRRRNDIRGHLGILGSLAGGPEREESLACRERSGVLQRYHKPSIHIIISIVTKSISKAATLQWPKQAFRKSRRPASSIDHIKDPMDPSQPPHSLPLLLIRIPKSLLDRLGLFIFLWLIHLQPVALGEILAHACAALAPGTALCCVVAFVIVGRGGGGLGAVVVAGLG